MMNYFILFYLIIYIINCVKAQEIPIEFIENQLFEYSLDLGENWETNTTLGLNRYKHRYNTSNTNLKRNKQEKIHRMDVRR